MKADFSSLFRRDAPQNGRLWFEAWIVVLELSKRHCRNTDNETAKHSRIGIWAQGAPKRCRRPKRVVIEAGEIARNSVVKILGTLFLERRANAEKLVRDAFDTSRIPVCLLNLRPTLGL